MGRGRSGRGSVRGKGKGEAGEKSQYITRVDLYKFLCKWELRSYPDNQGRPLFDPASRLTTEHLRKILDGDCSELLRRPLMGLNLSSASLDSAALFAPKLASSLPQIQAMLEKESLNEAVRYFNLNRDVERDSSASQEMCKVYFKQIQKAARDQGTVIAEAAEAAAAVYTGLVALLELAAISEDIRWWASKVPEVKKQTKHVQAWLAHPKEEDRLFKALAHGIKADEKKNMRRERTFGQLDAEAAGSSSSTPLSVNDSDSISTDSSSALSGKKKKKKKNARAHKKSNEAKHKKHRKTEKKAKGRDASDPKAKRARRHTKKTSSSSDSPSRSVRQKQRKVERGSDSTSAEAVPAAVAVLPPFREIWPLAEIQAFETKAQELATAAASAELAVKDKIGLLKCLPVEVPWFSNVLACDPRRKMTSCKPTLSASPSTLLRWCARPAWPGSKLLSTKTPARACPDWPCHSQGPSGLCQCPRQVCPRKPGLPPARPPPWLPARVAPSSCPHQSCPARVAHQGRHSQCTPRGAPAPSLLRVAPATNPGTMSPACAPSH